MDERLHAERLDPARPMAPARDLPNGAMVLWRGAPHLKARGQLWRWSFGDYGAPEPAGAGEVATLTPPSILAALKGGYRPRSEGTPLAVSADQTPA
jgi:hypothetical protein